MTCQIKENKSFGNFQHLLSGTELIDYGFKGQPFTGAIKQRGRTVHGKDWIELFALTKVEYLITHRFHFLCSFTSPSPPAGPAGGVCFLSPL